MIRFREVSKTYRSNTEEFHALHHITFDIEQNEILGIVGMSGAGKSTIFKLLTGVISPDCGEILVMDQPTHHFQERDWEKYRKSVGVIHQGYALLQQKSIYENIAFALNIYKVNQRDIPKRIEELLQLVGLESKAHLYPSNLSGGEKQRIAIARALAGRPQLILCDEPTSALDMVNAREILGLLRRLQRQFHLAIVIISHELGIIRDFTDRVIILEKGIIAESGVTHDVFSNPQSDIGKHLLGRR